MSDSLTLGRDATGRRGMGWSTATELLDGSKLLLGLPASGDGDIVQFYEDTEVGLRLDFPVCTTGLTLSSSTELGNGAPLLIAFRTWFCLLTTSG